jgi:primosomal protein N' (replication factor Y) (superfamily II helicase)
VTASEAEHNGRTAQVVPLLRLHHLGDRRFDYLVPADLAGTVGRGSIVTVPFGKRTVQAVVLGIGPSPEAPAAELRTIAGVAPDSIDGELIDLAEALAERYLCSLESCLRLVAPVGAASGRSRPAVPRNDHVRLAPQPEQAAAGKLTSKQEAALAAIPEAGISKKELCDLVCVGRGVLDALEKKGLIVSCPAPETTGEQQAGSVDAEPADPGLSLWPEQEHAVSALSAALDEPGLATRLLWGVTGSGKTEVYLRLIERALAQGRGSILLVPEIALTPQTIRRVKARFGSRVGVFHSGLPHGERLRDYRRVAAGEARIVVGARSAVFAPVKDLGLIIIDESHDNSYKQEEEPRYRVKTVAELRLRDAGGLILEGSATPLVESMDRPDERIRLSQRASGAFPDIEVVDMRRQGAGLLLAPRSRAALAEVLRKGEQAIILLNRRGFAGHVHCETCGHVLMCKDCELSLTYHQGERRLLCHHCGQAYPQPAACPRCGEAPLTRAAPGTERLDGELRTVVPGDQVFRMDSDVAGSGARTHAILQAFGEARPGVLVGTQMVAKGHDFPDVTLVIVADADVGLYVPDFRASERTFQLLTQVAGRAGRAERPGRVLVQTSNPDVPCIRMALAGEEEAFYSEELDGRLRLGYPPYTELIRLLTSSPDAAKAQAAARHLVERLGTFFPAVELHGPAPLPRLRGRHRWQVMVAARQGERSRTIIGKALEQLEEPYRRRGVTLLVDVDPLSFS